MNIQETISDGLKKLRAAYPTNIYVGGSYARHVCLGPTYEFHDVDVFVLGPRCQENWITQLLFEQLFDTVVCKRKDIGEFEFETEPEYVRIPNQYGLYTCTLGIVSFDILFIDTDINGIIDRSSASSLSMFYYKLDYSDNMLQIVDHDNTSRALNNIMLRNQCYVDEAKCSHRHINKIAQVCNKHNLTLIRQYT